MNLPATDGMTSGTDDNVRIVGIGASAGGLSALELFLKNTLENTSLAYIVVQHLDPVHKGMLPELLQRKTAMPVKEARQGMKIRADHVYVIPPNKELTVQHNCLHLAKPAEPRGMRLPIDVLFSSLAITQGERAIGVVLSGMGSDGSAGLEAIKAVGGLTLAQTPETAEFDSMPISAISAGYVDIVTPADELLDRIIAYTKQETEKGSTLIKPSKKTSSLSNAPLQAITKLMHQKTGHDFSLYKTSTLHRRIERRMIIHNIDSLHAYVNFLKHNAQEIELLFKELLIGVTQFFRDQAVWDYLKDSALPTLLTRRTKPHTFRAWCIGCSTGEEAYSLAIIFTEVIRQIANPKAFSVQIFASDLSPDAIATARRGRYPLSITDHIPQTYLTRYFDRHDDYYQIKQSIRDMVLFAQQDVIIDPPFTKLDLIVCRNLMIYFNTKLQSKLLPLFHYSLRPGGMMLLGSSETIGSFNYLFSAIASKFKLFDRRDNVPIRSSEFMLSSFPPLTYATKEFSVPSPRKPEQPVNSLQSAADHVLLQVYAPAAVVVNQLGDIVYISGRTGKYLEPAAGKANWNFHAMIRESLRAPLYLGLKQAMTQSEPIHLNGLSVQFEEFDYLVDITIQAFQEPKALKELIMVVFHDVDTANKHKRKNKPDLDLAHEAQLQQYRLEIETLREEARASKEELQSSNEELQSTNEELQSTNEELTTSKEEMQSMNEELQTINNELQTKLDDLALAQSDMQNILNSIEIAILFLDQKLNVRRFTERAAKIISLRESDVGRPLSDLTSCLIYPELNDDASEALRTLVFSEKEIPTDDGRWYSIRIMPYRRLDNMIDGVVITMVDISKTKK
ncbi:chemotaxis protein CheR [Thalassotalea insulae]|uniref:protein-glutamate O-methyltransferase n=1 Tax=Thalassotalea insulae TaxID=2056778 RepID=A0ABQ6GXJ6_9GAMM|nr:chemotaxis protein CheB [Thalassotalea insulae]GLX79475.1 chemotaxis protein CheR [Thalassotalea insulae]